MLYFVATPIGNLSEITFRAIEVLKQSDYIYAEDTRHSAVLLSKYEISAPLVSYQKFNERARCGEIISRLKDGKIISIISDAGMPLISDPGSVLREELIKEELEFTAISGASACINALVLSGLDASAFCMAGFLPDSNKAKKEFIKRFSLLTCTLIFYVPPHDIVKTLDFLHGELGSRSVAVVREISKKFEQVHRGILGTLIEIPEKGEMVLVVEGAKKANDFDENLSVLQHLEELIKEGLDKKDAVKEVARLRGIPKSDVYKVSLQLKK